MAELIKHHHSFISNVCYDAAKKKKHVSISLSTSKDTVVLGYRIEVIDSAPKFTDYGTQC